VADLKGVSPPEKRKGRAQLTVRDPHVEKLLAGLQFDGQDIAQLRRIGKVLWRWRNEWSVQKHARQSAERRRLFASARVRP
jgi:hypothetical protein